MIYAHSRDKGFKLTRLAIAEKIKSETGKHIDLIDNKPECPYELLYLWEVYNQISQGCEKVNYTELEAYQRIHKIEFKSWEADTLIDIDFMRRSKQ